jgi:hypothetical protein
VASDIQAKHAELERVKARLTELEAELGEEETTNGDWQRQGYYLTYYATTGFFLGMIGAITSLLFNVVGAVAFGLGSPLQIIKVYLTFGLGEKALDPSLSSGLVLAIGCCLYIATGMLLGVPFHLILTRFAADASLGKRLVIASLLGIAIWIINYYLLLSWIQPLLFGGNWILTEIPPWVAAATHLVFGWTMAVVYPWGLREPYRLQTEQ